MGPKVLTFVTGLLLGIGLSLSFATLLHLADRPSSVSSKLINQISVPVVVGLPNAESLPSGIALNSRPQTGATGELDAVIPGVVRVVADTVAGSGVIIDPAGLVLTSAHVLADEAEVRVIIESADPLRGQVVRVDETRDLALIQLPPGTYHSTPLGAGPDIILGAAAIVIGYPLNMSGPATITTGVISRTFYDAESRREVIQTDAAINLGNSGGPILDSQGKIVGIITSVIGEYKAAPTRGIGYAVSVDTIRRDFLDIVPAAALGPPKESGGAGPN